MDAERQWTPPPGAGPGPGWRPPRRRSQVRLVAVVLLALVLFVAVSGLSGLRLWPSFPNPFATRQVDRSQDRKSTRLNSSHTVISYAVFCLKKKKKTTP